MAERPPFSRTVFTGEFGTPCSFVQALQRSCPPNNKTMSLRTF